MEVATLERLLRPRSIAIIGASSTAGSLGECVLSNLEAGGFQGALHLVNPKRPILRGRQCLGSIQELPHNIDCAVLAIPGSAVLAAARNCAEKDVGSMIVFSAGFAEAGEEGQAAQHELAEIAKRHQIVLEGPNCLGMVNYLDRIPLTFVVTPPQEPAHVPGVAILSQSGALAAVIAVSMRHQMIPLTYSVSTGNEAASGIEDFVEYLIGDRSTRVMALIVEQFREPRRFLELARRARRNGQFLVLLHPGRSSAARVSAATHTGAIAGDYEVMHTLVTRAGVLHVDTMEELVDVTQILVRCSEPPRGGAAIFTESGAFKALALDHCERVGLELPKLSPASERALREVLPSFIPPSNPLDLTAQGLVDPTLYTRTLPPVLAEPRCGAVLLAIILTDPSTRDLKLPPILDAIRTLKPAKPVIFAAMDEGAPFESPHIQELRRIGIPCFPSPERAIRALARLVNVQAPRQKEHNEIAEFEVPASYQTGLLAEYKAKEILHHIGIRIPKGKLARTLDEARRSASEIGFPVVLKAQSPSLSHKSDAGGVILGIKSEDTLAKAWDALHANVKRHRPDLTLDGALVEKMSEEAGIELIVGARNDPQWGPVVLVGFGGILAEAIGDTRMLAADFSREEIASELSNLRCSPLLGGFRGVPEADIPAAADAIFRLGGLVQSQAEIEEIDINPLVVFASGKGVLALDAVFSFRSV